MRVRLVSLDFKPYRSSGLTIYAEDLACGLRELGLTVSVLAARRAGLPPLEEVEGVTVYRVPLGGLDWITYARRAAGLLADLQHRDPWEVVHFLDVHFAYAYEGPYVASLWQSFRQRLTAREGGPYHTGPLDWLTRQVYYRLARRWMEGPSLGRARRLIAHCRATRDEFVGRYGVPAGRVDLAVQGIDPSFFRPRQADGLRRDLGLEGCRVLLFVGFLTPRKGLEVLAAALRRLPEDVHLVVAGRWAPRYRPLVMRALGSAAGRFHEVGFLPDAERPRYYSLADVYVSASYLEGLGVTPLEAQACGTPAVVTSAASGPEEVGEAGLVVPPGDPEALAGAVADLLADEAHRRALGRRGRARVLALFTIRRMAELTLQSYRKADWLVEV